MLEHALKVVEAARKMELTNHGGVTRSDLKMRDLAFALEGLRQSIEDFDRGTSIKSVGMANALKPDFATPPQLADDSVQEELLLQSNLSQSPTLQHGLNEDVVDNDIKSPQRKISLAPLSKPVLAAAVLSRITHDPKSNPDGSLDNYDLGGDGVFYDGDESAGDLLMSIDAINDKLAFAIKKVGWSPRLRSMAGALRKAQENMFIQVDNGVSFVRIPAHNWGPLSVAIAECALDQDLSIALPQPKLKSEMNRDNDHEKRFGPKPPAEW